MKPSNIALTTGVFWASFVFNARVAVPFSDYLMTHMSNVSFLNKEKNNVNNSFNSNLIKIGRFVTISSVFYASVLYARHFMKHYKADILFAGFCTGAVIGGKLLAPSAIATTAKALKAFGAYDSIECDYHDLIQNRNMLVDTGRSIQLLGGLKKPFIEKHGLANYMSLYCAENATVIATAIAVNTLIAYALF